MRRRKADKGTAPGADKGAEKGDGPAAEEGASGAEPRRVWDLPTRLFHWGLAASVAGAFATARLDPDPERLLHRAFGTAVLALVAFRLLWGPLGNRQARLRRLAPGPRGEDGGAYRPCSGASAV